MCVCVCVCVCVCWKNKYKKIPDKSFPEYYTRQKDFAENKARQRCHASRSDYSLEALPSGRSRLSTKRVRWGLLVDEFA